MVLRVIDPCISACEAPSMVNATDANRSQVPFITMREPVCPAMPGQSPTLGVVAGPSPLLAPPAVSSFHDVNTTGAGVVPWTTNDPFTDRLAEDADWTTVPAATVNVTPDATVTLELSRYTCAQLVVPQVCDELI